MIDLTVNGKPVRLEEPLTILEYLKYQDYDLRLVLIEWNFTTYPKEDWPKIILADGGNLEIIKIVGGG